MYQRNKQIFNEHNFLKTKTTTEVETSFTYMYIFLKIIHGMLHNTMLHVLCTKHTVIFGMVQNREQNKIFFLSIYKSRTLEDMEKLYKCTYTNMTEKKIVYHTHRVKYAYKLNTTTDIKL